MRLREWPRLVHPEFSSRPSLWLARGTEPSPVEVVSPRDDEYHAKQHALEFWVYGAGVYSAAGLRRRGIIVSSRCNSYRIGYTSVGRLWCRQHCAEPAIAYSANTADTAVRAGALFRDRGVRPFDKRRWRQNYATFGLERPRPIGIVP
jgi:hypothetical protein